MTKPHRRAAEQLGSTINHCGGCHEDVEYEGEGLFECGCCCCKAHSALLTKEEKRRQDVEALR